MRCNNHQEQDAQGMCVLCGKPYCESCIVDVSGKYKCRECLKNAQDTPPVITNPPEDADSGFWNGVGFCCCIMLILSII